MRDHSELKNLPAVLAQASEWDLTTERLEAQVKKITVRLEWTKPRPQPKPLSFLGWLKQDPHRCPPLWFALVEHSDTYLSDPRFEHMNHEEWLAFARVHGVFDDEFRAAWRMYRSSQQRNGIELVN